MTIQDIISSNSDATSEFKNRITKKNIEREISLRIEDFKRSFYIFFSKIGRAHV